MTGPGDNGLGSGGMGLDGELALSNEDSLPWLESEEYDEESGGLDIARIVGFAVIALVVIGAGVAGAWWYSNRDQRPEHVADGSTVEAPAQPYKERPADPGGKEFAGTGNVAPGVGEGAVREGVLRTELPEPTPAPAPPETASTSAPAASGPSIATLPSGERTTTSQETGISVQVGAYRNRARAEAGWVTLQRQTTALNGVKRRIVRGESDIGTVYRLQALPGDLAAARALCQALKDDGVACQVKR